MQRLNGVYNGIMKSAGVELIGALGLPCKLLSGTHGCLTCSARLC